MYFNSIFLKPQAIEKRKYQENILETAKIKNTLCVLPTGMGKTPIAILLAAHRLEEFEGKILVIAPTKPLCEQHERSFRENLELDKNEILLVTGKIPAQNRKVYYEKGKVICATPQTIQNDLENDILNLKYFCLLVVDEVHRSVGKYANSFVAKKYIEQAENPRILGLTASPGSSQERIDEICKNLFIENVEIRTERDEDVKPYVKNVEIKTIRVDLSLELKESQEKLKSMLKETIERLKKMGVYIYSKKDLVLAQSRIQRALAVDKRPMYFMQISSIAETLKIWHALELIETQSAKAVKDYIERLGEKNDKASKRILSDSRFKTAKENILKLLEKDEEHPKILKLKQVILSEVERNPRASIIVFSHYRDNIDKLKNILNEICRPVVLIGQSTTSTNGMTQKEQVNIIKDFNAGVYNVLITSSIGEEGLHISSADTAIFFEPVASEIRTIQRKGRVGRTQVGKVIFLITSKTRDEANYYIAQRKERKMKEIIKGMQNKNGLEKYL